MTNRATETSQMFAACISPSARTSNTFAVKQAAEASIKARARRWRELFGMGQIKTAPNAGAVKSR
jgi:hypothetical protein